jgi:hypothetical protein
LIETAAHALPHDRLRARHLPSDLHVRPLIDNRCHDRLALVRRERGKQLPQPGFVRLEVDPPLDRLDLGVIEHEGFEAEFASGAVLHRAPSEAVNQLVTRDPEQPGRRRLRLSPKSSGPTASEG